MDSLSTRRGKHRDRGRHVGSFGVGHGSLVGVGVGYGIPTTAVEEAINGVRKVRICHY